MPYLNVMREYHKLFMTDVRRRFFEENWQRVNKCLDLISEDQLWYQQNENVNSIGNLILHLRGNITQYICSGIFREKDMRERDLEFSSTGEYRIEELRSIFAETMNMISEKFDLITPEMLVKQYEVQGFTESGVAIMVHVTEHFSYHVGQITYITKLLNEVDTGYYADFDLNQKSV